MPNVTYSEISTNPKLHLLPKTKILSFRFLSLKCLIILNVTEYKHWHTTQNKPIPTQRGPIFLVIAAPQWKTCAKMPSQIQPASGVLKGNCSRENATEENKM